MRSRQTYIAAIVLLLAALVAGPATAATVPRATWQYEYVPRARARFSAMDQYRGIIYAIGNTQLFRSTDGGKSWKARLVQFGIRAHTMVVLDHETFLVGNSDGVFRSTDTGLTWDRMTDHTMLTIYSLLRLENRILGMGLTYSNWTLEVGGSIIESRDRGKTWAKVLNPWPKGLSNICTDPERKQVFGFVHSYGKEDRWLASPDGGQTWVTAEKPNDPICASGGSFLDNENPEGEIPEAGLVTTLVRMPGGSLVGVGQDGRVVRKDPLSGRWEQRTSLPDYRGGKAAAATGPDGNLYVSNGFIYRSRDEGATWSKLSLGTDGLAPGGSGLAITAAGDIFVTAFQQVKGQWVSSLLHSRDLGVSWRELPDFACKALWTDGQQVACWDDKNVYKARLLVTSDRGNTWNEWLLPRQGPYRSEQGEFVSGPAGVILFTVSGGNAVSNRGVFTTTDSGKSWAQLDAEWRAIWPLGDGKLISRRNGVVSVSNDGGVTWIGQHIPDKWPAVVFPISDTEIYGSDSAPGGIWRYVQLPPLADIEGHWAQATVELLVKAGIISGYPDGSFRPEQPVSRAALVKLLVTARQLELIPAAKIPFRDAESSWVAKQGYLGAALEVGMIQEADYPGGNFEPDQAVSRAEMARFLVRGAGLEGEVTKYTGNLPFIDADRIPANLRGYVGVAVANGLLQGVSAPNDTVSLDPNHPLTRAQAATVIHWLLKRW